MSAELNGNRRNPEHGPATDAARSAFMAAVLNMGPEQMITHAIQEAAGHAEAAAYTRGVVARTAITEARKAAVEYQNGLVDEYVRPFLTQPPQPELELDFQDFESQSGRA